MNYEIEDTWQTLSISDKKQRLFEEQKKLLDCFLERGAISKAQSDRSYGDMKKKMFPCKEDFTLIEGNESYDKEASTRIRSTWK